MPERYVFVFLDGTSCDLITGTNVARIHNIFDKATSTKCIYEPGPDKYSEMANFQALISSEAMRVASTVYRRLTDADVCRSDKLYIIGYSRGAVIARMLAQMITNKNLRHEIIRKENLEKYVDCDIEFMGLFDPVIGFPYFFPKRAKEYDAVFNTKIKKYLEIVSIDESALYLVRDSLATYFRKNQPVTHNEQRAPAFSRVKDSEKISPYRNQTIENRTFIYMPGVHADIGGQESDMYIAAHSGLTMLKELLIDDPHIRTLADSALLDDLRHNAEFVQSSTIGPNRPIWKKLLGFGRLISNNEHCFVHRIAQHYHGEKGKNGNLILPRLRRHKARKGLMKTKVYMDEYSLIFT